MDQPISPHSLPPSSTPQRGSRPLSDSEKDVRIKELEQALTAAENARDDREHALCRVLTLLSPVAGRDVSRHPQEGGRIAKELIREMGQLRSRAEGTNISVDDVAEAVTRATDVLDVAEEMSRDVIEFDRAIESVVLDILQWVPASEVLEFWREPFPGDQRLQWLQHLPPNVRSQLTITDFNAFKTCLFKAPLREALLAFLAGGGTGDDAIDKELLTRVMKIDAGRALAALERNSALASRMDSAVVEPALHSKEAGVRERAILVLGSLRTIAPPPPSARRTEPARRSHQ